MACGAKVPVKPKTEKNKVKKKKGFKLKAAAAVIAVVILALVSVPVFGDGMVPEKIRDNIAYSWLTGTIKDKFPHEVKLPFGLAVKFPY